MQELIDALEAQQKSIDALIEVQQATQAQFVAIQEQFKAQKAINDQVMSCLRYLMGVEKERPTLRLVTDE